MPAFVAIDTSGANDTAAMSAYRERTVYPYLQGKSFQMMPFFGALARPEYVAPAAVRPEVGLLSGASHGTYSELIGFGTQPVFAIGTYNPEEVRGKVAHFFACDTARDLGPDFVQKGCLAYIGYDDNFVFDPDSQDLFFKCDGQVLIGLADGLTVGAAVTAAKALFTQTIAMLQAQGKIDAAHQLEFDLAHFRSPLDGAQWGSAEVTLI